MSIDLPDIMRDIKERLGAAASDRSSPMHTPVVGTADGDTRIMVLRDFDPQSYTLRFNTDARSPKLCVVDSTPAVSVLLYDKEAKIQIRVRGTGRIERDGSIADRAWAQSDNYARRCYLAENAPGTASAEATSGLPEWVEGIRPTDDQIAPGRANFAVLLVRIEQIDWFYLANSGHRRALVTIAENREDFEIGWISP